MSDRDRSKVSGQEPRAGLWDFDGACANGKWNVTFSLGIFQWVPKSRGKGLKRGAVQQRVRGLTSAREAGYAKARSICDALNAEAQSE